MCVLCLQPLCCDMAAVIKNDGFQKPRYNSNYTYCFGSSCDYHPVLLSVASQTIALCMCVCLIPLLILLNPAYMFHLQLCQLLSLPLTRLLILSTVFC